MSTINKFQNSQYTNLFIRAHQQIAATGKENFIRNLLPNGEKRGADYVALNPTRNDKHLGSFRINVFTGKWSDFATTDKGGDLISLYAYIKNITQYEATCEILDLETPVKRGK